MQNLYRVGHKVFSVFSRLFRRFRREERGVVLILVVLLIVPLLLVIAVGIDFGQSLIVKRQLTSAVDAAALAIGSEPDLTDDEALNDKAEAYIKSHYPASGIGTLKTHGVVRTEDPTTQDIEVNVTASAEIPTSFMKLGGVDKLTVAASSKVVRRERDLEIVMVLDNSGSMSGSKIASLKSAANTLVNVLFAGEETSEDVRVALVPFTGSVNVNVPATTSWLDKNTPAPIHDYMNLASDQSVFDVIDTMDGGIAARWGGCVRSRVGGHDVLDTEPTTSSPDTLFSASFAPYLGEDPTAYEDDAPSGSLLDQAQNENCPQATVQPLTNTKTTITTAIEAMNADDSTNIPEALAWGWRVVSSGEPFTEGAPYSDQGVLKAIIVLTDGDNSSGGSSNFFSYGYGGSDNPQVGPSVDDILDLKTTEVCNNIKANHDSITDDNDIIIYSIVFGSVSPSTEIMMENCASDPGFYFNSPTGTELESHFKEIATGLNELRVAQ